MSNGHGNGGAATPPPAPTPARLFTRSEVRESGAASSAALLVSGRLVLDVSTFLDAHPGGAELLLQFAGEDATSAFASIGHSERAVAQALSFTVGRLREGE